MSMPSDFRLYHSNALDVLAGLLAEELRAPVPGQSLLAPDVVLIPQAAMRRWLQATLAQAHGIAANLEFLTPGEFVRRALDANVPGASDDLPGDALHWRLYAALRDPVLRREPALRSLRDYLGDGDPLKPWTLAGELAGLFEKYQAWRRDWLLAWEAGDAPRDPQAALWRHVAAGRAHRARRIDAYLRGFAGDDAPQPAGLPARLFAFATLNVSPDVLRVIASQARVGTLHFYLPTPTRAYWGDLQTLAERLRAGEAPFDEDAADNPLLQAWGAAGRDFMAVLGSYEVVHPRGEIAAYAEPLPRAGDALCDGLLKRLQRDLFHRRGTPGAPLRNAVDRDDPTLQVHACHTRLREVQVLHDQLRALLDDPRFDPPLQPREIAVLAPDIDPYAPYVEAVFGGRAGHADFIPYALADASPLAGEPLAEVFLRLLALPVSRFGVHEVLDLLASPPVAAANGLDAVALDRLADWLREAGARWGLDARHRAAQGAPADDAFTWRFALDRLLLGHAAGDDDIIVSGGTTVAPWPGLEGHALDALDVLLRLLRVLERHALAFAEAMPPAQWRDRLLGLLEAMLPETPRDAATQRALARLHALVNAFADAAAQAGTVAPVPPEVLRAHFAAALAEADTRAPLLTGGVSFGRMVPLRLLPFRVLCVLGLNDGDYPRRDPASALNRLAAELGTTRRRFGDRSVREDDRFLFLQLFAAAGDVFYLSYLGADARDGSARAPSVLVGELLDAAAAQHTDRAAARADLVVHHPLQPFTPAAFGSADELRRFSYRREWQQATDAGAVARGTLAPWCDAPLPPPHVPESAAEPDVLTSADLRRFLRAPAAAFLRERLALRLPGAPDVAEDVEPLLLPGGGLDRYALDQAVLDAVVSGDTDRLAERLRARGLLPAGPLAARQLDALRRTAQDHVALFDAWRGDARAQALSIDLALGGQRVQGRIDGVFGDALARLRLGAPSGPSTIRDGLDWLLANAAGHACALVQFHDEGDGPVRRERAPLDAANARAALQALLRLRAEGLAEPLPWGPYAGWALFDADTPEKGLKAARERWQGQNGGWGEGQADAVRLALRGRALFDDPALVARFIAITRAVFVPLTHGMPAVDAEAAA